MTGRLVIQDDVLRALAEAPVLTIPKNPPVREALVNWTACFDDYANEGTTGEQRAGFARKLAAYYLHTGPWKVEEGEVHRGMLWFARRPARALSRVLYVSAIARQTAAVIAESPSHATGQIQAARCALATPATLKDAIADFGAYRLERLTHARHLVEAGVAGRNCLCFKRGEDILPDPDALRDMMSGEEEFLTLSKGDTICLLFSLRDSALWQMQFIAPDLTPPDVLERCRDAVHARYGTVDVAVADYEFSDLWRWPRLVPEEITDVFLVARHHGVTR